MEEDLFSSSQEEEVPRPRRVRKVAAEDAPDSRAFAWDELQRDVRGADPRPLAERLRPRSLAEFQGQGTLLGPEGPLRRLIAADAVPSMILWGPPGSGKTTLAGIIARETKSDFIPLSAVTASVKDVRSVIESAKLNRQFNRRTILFVDEIHRFNKAQQDAFLPHVEDGLVTLIGATTENPSFSVISPLLSRSRVFVLQALDAENLVAMLRRGLDVLARDTPDFQPGADDDALAAIVRLSDGDARRAIGLLELCVAVKRSRADATPLTRGEVASYSQRHLPYDRDGEEHYNLISALHKTLRSSDPHAAVYYLHRMLAAGEDPLFVARRMIRFASEDIGLADPNALVQAMEAMRAFQNLGSPEGELALTQACVYLALAPKSNALYRAEKAAKAEIAHSGALPVPLHLRNAPTQLMKEVGYAEGYAYDHDAPAQFIAKQGLPDALTGRTFYTPTENGWEGRRRDALAEWDAARAKLSSGGPPETTG